MLRIFALTFLAFCLSLQLQANELDRVRKSFHNAVLNKTQIAVFQSLSDSLPIDIPVFQAYKAVAQALQAQEKWNPLDKLAHLLKFQNQISEAIKSDPTNLEIRFLRFCVEYNIPSWLSMNQHLIEDKDHFIGHAEQIVDLKFDPFFSHYILYFIIETGLCTEEDTRIIFSKLAMK